MPWGQRVSGQGGGRVDASRRTKGLDCGATAPESAIPMHVIRDVPRERW